MTQILLFPDPRPLVERLGPEFFRRAPERPGVYLMRDATDAVLYVGKAKNLRKRLASYRVANPDRLRRRHLRLLRAVDRIEFQECADEAAALARESELLLSLRPRFNRAGTWIGSPRFLAWRLLETGLELAVQSGTDPEWPNAAAVGGGAFAWRTVLARLLWCGLHPDLGLAGMPEGWFHGGAAEVLIFPNSAGSEARLGEPAARLKQLYAGQAGPLSDWVRERALSQQHPFEVAAREADLESLVDLAEHLAEPGSGKAGVNGEELAGRSA